MKKRHAITQNIKSLLQMLDNNEVSFDFPLQRAKGQWSHYTKSLLIHSIMQDYDIPAVYSTSERIVSPDGLRDNFAYKLIDGLQRISTIQDFCNNEFALHKDTPAAWDMVGENTNKHEVAGKTFEELDESLQNTIMDYQLTMYYFIGMTEDEMIEMFSRMGNGKPLNAQQKAKAQLGMQMARNLNDITQQEFYKNYTKLTPAQFKNADDEKVTLQALMAMDDSFETYLAYDGKTMENYARALKASDNTDLFSDLEVVLDYAVAAISASNYDKMVVLKKRYLTYVIVMANYGYCNGVEPYVFGEWLVDLSERIESESEYYKALFAQTTKNKSREGIRHIQYVLEQSLKVFQENKNNAANQENTGAAF